MRFAFAAIAGLMWIAPAIAQNFTPRDESPEQFPAGAGRDETFYACTACHGSAVIRRSRLTREGWDELMDWMTEKHGMPPLEADERRVVVDYLARVFPQGTQQQQRRRGDNPFLAR